MRPLMKKYTVPNAPLSFELNKEAAETGLTLPVDPPLELVPIKADEVTDEQIGQARAFAAADPKRANVADALAETATTRRNEAVAALDKDGEANTGIDQGTIAEFVERRRRIEEEHYSDPRNAGNMREMRASSASYSNDLQGLLDDLYAYLAGCDGLDVEGLAASQEAWEQDWQNKSDAMRAEFAENHYSGNAFGLNIIRAGGWNCSG